MRDTIDEIRLLLDKLSQQFGVDIADIDLSRSAKVISDRRHLLSCCAISLWFYPDNFGEWLNCLAPNLGKRNHFLFHAIGIVKTLLYSSCLT